MIELQEKKITVEEFREMEFPDTDHFIYELINGILMRKASPKVPHQRVSMRLSVLFGKWIEKNQAGEFFAAPMDVFFDTYNQAQPDLFFIKNERNFIIDERDGTVMGAPDLIIEIVSPGSIKADRIIKKELYEQFGVKEYWITDPNNRALEIYVLKENTYFLHQILEIEGKIQSTILTDFEADVKDIFE